MKTGKPRGRRPRPIGYTRIINGRHYIKTADGWRMRHRYVWEQAFGPIPPGGVIHHINHDKLDDRLENLKLCASRAEHHREHLEEHRERCRAMASLPRSPEHVEKIAAQHRGRKRPKETGRRISAALTGIQRDETFRQARREMIASRQRDPLTGRLLPSP